MFFYGLPFFIVRGAGCLTESGVDCVNDVWRDVLGRWYRACRQTGSLAKPKWECATSTNTEGYWTTLS